MELKILCIDDDAIQNEIMFEYINLCKIKNSTDFFTNGYDAISHLENSSFNELPQVIFIDIFMPLINGWETLAKLELTIEKKNWFPTIYMLSSSVSNIDITFAAEQKYLKAFLNKPLRLAKLKPILKDEYDRIFSTNK